MLAAKPHEDTARLTLSQKCYSGVSKRNRVFHRPAEPSVKLCGFIGLRRSNQLRPERGVPDDGRDRPCAEAWMTPPGPELHFVGTVVLRDRQDTPNLRPLTTPTTQYAMIIIFLSNFSYLYIVPLRFQRCKTTAFLTPCDPRPEHEADSDTTTFLQYERGLEVPAAYPARVGRMGLTYFGSKTPAAIITSTKSAAVR